jgi:predicted DNA-binding protein (MmcQ/YjbR family)
MWDFAINEECYRYNECSMYAPFKNGEQMHPLSTGMSAAVAGLHLKRKRWCSCVLDCHQI